MGCEESIFHKQPLVVAAILMRAGAALTRQSSVLVTVTMFAATRGRGGSEAQGEQEEPCPSHSRLFLQPQPMWPRLAPASPRAQPQEGFPETQLSKNPSFQLSPGF